MKGCPVCRATECVALHRGTDSLYGTTKETFTIARCKGCGMARLDPAPANPERFYPDRYWHEPSPGEEAYRKLVIRDHVGFARQTLSRTRQQFRVLDVGCGSGLFLRQLRRALPGVRAIGIDASPRAAALARRNGVPAISAELTHAPLASASLDLITMFHVLEHLPDPAAHLDAARRLLAVGGRLVVQTPNLDCWQYRVWKSRWNGLDIPRHLFDFRLDDLRRLLGNCGFRIVRLKHFSWRDNPAGLAATIAPALEPVARAARGARPRNALFLALTAAALPFAALEALFGHGSSVMAEAALL